VSDRQTRRCRIWPRQGFPEWRYWTWQLFDSTFVLFITKVLSFFLPHFLSVLIEPLLVITWRILLLWHSTPSIVQLRWIASVFVGSIFEFATSIDHDRPYASLHMMSPGQRHMAGTYSVYHDITNWTSSSFTINTALTLHFATNRSYPMNTNTNKRQRYMHWS
jgi:hypothetical protein